ncbi:MAG: rhomboid family intramembrane serine protease [Phycisphaerales bacterium]
MALSDRDYVRSGPARTSSGMGRLRFLSFNTWLIVINVAVFVLTGLLNTSPFLRPQWFSPEFDRGVTQQQIARHGFLERPFDPRGPRVQELRVFVDPQQTVTDPLGRVVVDQNGTPLPARIGVQRAVGVSPLQAWGHFSTAKAFFQYEVWRLVTFQFLHASLTHLIFNMLGLWFVGGLVEQYLGSKRYAAFYLTCGIFGALVYLVLNFVGNYILPTVRLPGLLFDDPFTPLVGASAGIFGVLMAAAFIAPTAIVHVLGILPLRMKTAVYAFTLLAFVSLLFGQSNRGGEAAHVGGAIAGYFFIRRTHLLRDFFDIFTDSRKGVESSRAAAPGPAKADVDRILAKIADSGLSSLSDAERRTLRAATDSGQRD